MALCIRRLAIVALKVIHKIFFGLVLIYLRLLRQRQTPASPIKFSFFRRLNLLCILEIKTKNVRTSIRTNMRFHYDRDLSLFM